MMIGKQHGVSIGLGIVIVGVAVWVVTQFSEGERNRSRDYQQLDGKLNLIIAKQDGMLSREDFQRWIQRLQRDNKDLEIPELP